MMMTLKEESMLKHVLQFCHLEDLKNLAREHDRRKASTSKSAEKQRQEGNSFIKMCG